MAKEQANVQRPQPAKPEPAQPPERKGLGPFAFAMALVPWAAFPMLLLIPQLRVISFCFYCFSPLAILGGIAGLTAGRDRKFAIAAIAIGGVFYAGLLALYGLEDYVALAPNMLP